MFRAVKIDLAKIGWKKKNSEQRQTEIRSQEDQEFPGEEPVKTMQKTEVS